MNERGLRSTLQYGLCFGVAVALHAALFLIPGGTFAPRSTGMERGVRLRVFRPAPISASPARSAVSATRAGATGGIRQSPGSGEIPPESLSRIVGDGGLTGKADLGGGSGGTGEEAGDAGTGPAVSEYGQYLARLRSDSVQGWAKERAQVSRRGWKGKGAGAGSGSGTGWGPGIGPGSGGVPGKGGGTYLDPRIQMVVTSYPKTGIEQRFTRVVYPDLKFKKSEYTAGWWNVYIQLWTDGEGGIRKLNVLRPETNGPLERQFVEQVKREIATWTFDPVKAEILVDVRFYVE